MVCLGNMCMDTLNKGANDDDNNNKGKTTILRKQSTEPFVTINRTS